MIPMTVSGVSCKVDSINENVSMYVASAFSSTYSNLTRRAMIFSWRKTQDSNLETVAGQPVSNRFQHLIMVSLPYSLLCLFAGAHSPYDLKGTNHSRRGFCTKYRISCFHGMASAFLFRALWLCRGSYYHLIILSPVDAS